METPAPFDLNRAIQQWRRELAQSPALSGKSCEELESHLRESTANLQCNGLTSEEAFLIAKRRLGSAPELEAEFKKVHNICPWINGALAMIICLQLWSLFRTIWQTTSQSFISLLMSQWQASPYPDPQTIPHLPDIAVGLLGIIPLAVLLRIIWLARSRYQAPLAKLFDHLVSHPWRLAGTSLILGTASTAIPSIYFVAVLPFISQTPVDSHLLKAMGMNQLFQTPYLFLLPGIVLALAKKRSLQTA